MRPPEPSEERVVRALAKAGVITSAQAQSTMTALAASDQCTNCKGSGEDPNHDPSIHADTPTPACPICQGTGQTWTLP